MCRLFWFWFFVQSSGSAYRECHQPTPHSVHASSCGPSRRAGALIIALFLPKLTNLRNQRLETKIVPGLLKQIYEAEMIYSATAGRELRMRWHSAGGIRGKLDWKAAANTSLKKYFRIDYYNISLDCADEAKPRSFRVNTVSNQGYILDPHISIDETGCSQICLGVLSPREMVTSIPL
jgi:hypothetical protein